MSHALAAVFLASLRSLPATTIDPRAIDLTLRELCAAAEAAYRGIAVTETALVRHVAERIDPTRPLHEALATLRTADLRVACGCALGDRGAILVLESVCIAHAQGALRKRSIGEEIAEEANQNVRERLLVGNGRPRILDYDGTGDLKSWVRVVVVREAIHLSKQGKKEVPLSYDLLEAPSAADSPEIAYFKAHYRAEYKDAFEAAVQALTARERALLRQQVVLGMSIDEIGLVYQVHRATAARWVEAARTAVLVRSRQELALRLRLPHAEIEAIVRMIESQLVLSMSRLLRASPSHWT